MVVNLYTHRTINFYADDDILVISSLNFIAGQGRNADALALYFGEDPARCPFEQGK